MQKLSAYILTYNSEKYLEKILASVNKVADEIIIVDSGSNDNTEKIAKSFDKVNFIVHPFFNFKSQRTFAADSCNYDYVLFLDSDELPDENFIMGLIQLKEKDFEKDAYVAERHWNILGKNISVFYPIISPDFPVRLYNKKVVNFNNSNLVHETPDGFKTLGKLHGKLLHFSFEDREIMEKKLQFYTDIAAEDLIIRNKKIGKLSAFGSAISAFIKWYFIKKGFLDGLIGLTLGIYAYRYSLLKYLKALKKLNKIKNQSTSS